MSRCDKNEIENMESWSVPLISARATSFCLSFHLKKGFYRANPWFKVMIDMIMMKH